MTMNQIWRAK